MNYLFAVFFNYPSATGGVSGLQVPTYHTTCFVVQSDGDSFMPCARCSVQPQTPRGLPYYLSPSPHQHGLGLSTMRAVTLGRIHRKRYQAEQKQANTILRGTWIECLRYPAREPTLPAKRHRTGPSVRSLADTPARASHETHHTGYDADWFKREILPHLKLPCIHTVRRGEVVSKRIVGNIGYFEQKLRTGFIVFQGLCSPTFVA